LFVLGLSGAGDAGGAEKEEQVWAGAETSWVEGIGLGLSPVVGLAGWA
jgi:hypothetical protein